MTSCDTPSSPASSPSKYDLELRTQKYLTTLIKMVYFAGRNDGPQKHEEALLGGGVEDLFEMLHELEGIFLKVVFVEISDEIFTFQIVERGADGFVEKAYGSGNALSPLPSRISSTTSSSSSSSAATTATSGCAKGGMSGCRLRRRRKPSKTAVS